MAGSPLLELAARTQPRCLALGAGRLRIVRQLLTESLLLGLLGSGIGILLALAGTRALVGLGPPIPRLEEVEVSWRVLLFAVGTGLCTGLLFGLAPLAMLAREQVGKTLAARGRGATAAGRGFQGAAISFQVALTVVLLVAGGLLSRSLWNVLAVDPGFDVENVATLRVVAPKGRYATHEEASRFFQDVVREMEAVPGVVSVSGAQGLPFPGGCPINNIQIEGRGTAGSVAALRRTVLPGYHATLDIPLLAGRSFSERDREDHPGVMIVSESMARRDWPAGSPVGTTVRFWDRPRTIVGIAGDVRHSTLSTEGEPTFYVPYAQVPRRDLRLVARLILVFGVVAALLAAAGVFGVTARAVAQRTREIGIRMALGAPERGLVTMVLRHSVTVGMAGAVAGLLAAAWSGGLLSRVLFGVQAWDPLTYGAVTLLVLLMCLVASYLPATRAARVAPVEVLREE